MDGGYLKVILGSMFSGKTTELIKEYNKYVACGFNCCFINHSLDKGRFHSGTNTRAHNKLSVKTDFIINKLAPSCNHPSFLHYDVIFINEGQFFPDLYEAVDWLLWKKKKVYVCGLDGDFQRKKFGSILDIIPLCDDVIKLKAICKKCKMADGIFTKRLSKEKRQTVIGSENYTSLCRNCYKA